ncbi:hypothetical protein COJ85_06595 [Bacillus sp. AFS076308]|uniref:hypothetical protein n=1 Tax=unclassified Bacillus (in: firmicutes) TaxID=185979 RepID=UPI000BF92DCF|nr:MULTISPECIES: hypothetical protein [unclassified Bacillus (in: firmicutes)]PFO06577.1 hypothetical protein COJ85_06595 [Bacillus sp. AFS076308]PGV52870.1 hypothetical protein COD92_09330 [Bacillus sp. AFS037270]
MLMIRHSIGSRLLCQTDIYNIEKQHDHWLISVPVDERTASEILDFQDELNIFEVKENEKAWFYSSDAQINFQRNDKQLIILADHKTVYPT